MHSTGTSRNKIEVLEIKCLQAIPKVIGLIE